MNEYFLYSVYVKKKKESMVKIQESNHLLSEHNVVAFAKTGRECEEEKEVYATTRLCISASILHRLP